MTGQSAEFAIDSRETEGAASLEACVQRRLGRRVRGFRMELTEDGVVLSGGTLTYYVKQLAQHTVMEVTGLPILANDIVVLPADPAEEVFDGKHSAQRQTGAGLQYRPLAGTSQLKLDA